VQPKAVGPEAVGDTLAPPVDLADQATIDLEKDGARPRKFLYGLRDYRAYRLTVWPRARTRFGAFFPDGLAIPEASGPAVSFWTEATRRPDPIGLVEFLPVFVWEDLADGSLERTIIARLAWRRSRALPGEQSSTVKDLRAVDRTQLWFSSGAEEKLGVLFDPRLSRPGAVWDPATAPPTFVTQWGADTIRSTGFAPDWAVPSKQFDGPIDRTRRFENQWLPLAGTGEETTDGRALAARSTAAGFHKVDVLAIEPEYDATNDAWFIDVSIDHRFANSWVRLGLARFQEHAPHDDGAPLRSLRLSTPSTTDFELKPRRSIKVQTLRKDKDADAWPIVVEVRGPWGLVSGQPIVPPGKDPYGDLTSIRPRFTLKLLRRSDVLVNLAEGGDVVVAEADSDSSPPPEGELLWRTTLYVKRNPYRTRHFVFIEEMDQMLSAHPEGELIGKGEGMEAKMHQLAETGPTFMAKVRVRPPAGARAADLDDSDADN